MIMNSNVKIRTRALRIAFLIDATAKETVELVNKIIRFATQCWGGAYYPIIPCNGTFIEDYWWRLLLHYDPDVIRATSDLESDLVQKIYQRLAPCDFEVRPNDPLGGLSPLECSFIPSHLVQTKSFYWNETPIYLYQSWNSKVGEDELLFRLNFGMIDQTIATDYFWHHSQIGYYCPSRQKYKISSEEI